MHDLSRADVTRIERRAGCVLLAGLCCLAAGAQGAGAAETPDRSATRAYLQAAGSLDEALVTNSHASDVDGEAFAAGMKQRCAGVLAKVPRTSTGPMHSESARARGEAARLDEQLTAVRFDLLLGLGSAVLAPDRGAVAAFKQTVAQLHWSDPAVGRATAIAGSLLVAFAEAPPRDVCADIQVWVASGYRRLTPAAREALPRLDAPLFEALAAALSPRGRSLASLLERYEDGPLRALAMRVAGLALPTEFFPGHALAIGEQLAKVVGLEEQASEPGPHPKNPIVGAGLTDADGRFVLRMERSSSPHGGCRWLPEVEYSETSDFLPNIASEGEGSAECGTPAPDPHKPEVSCGAGEVTIQARSAPAVRRIRLRLSNGRSVTSAPLVIPRRFGGPSGFYYQVIRGQPPRAVVLSELGAGGRVLKAYRLPHTRCLHEAVLPPAVAIAHGSTPDGIAFEIFGRYEDALPNGRATEFHLTLRGPFERDRGGEESDRSETLEDGLGPLLWSLRSRCGPPESAVVYGLLHAPADSVLARTKAGLVPLTKAPIPARLHRHGVVVYGSFPEPPSQLTVRNAAGKTVATRNLGNRTAEHQQFCAGYAES